MISSTLDLRYVRPRKGNASIVEFDVYEPTLDAVCPITQDPILDSELDFMQGCSFLSEHPHLKGMRLRCGHEFSAMNLVYYWARNRTVLCPVCRGGPAGAYLDMTKLPVHFRADMGRKVRSERRRDVRERILENEEAARALNESENHWIYQYASQNVSCAVMNREVRDSREMVYGFRVQCAVRITDGDFQFMAVVPALTVRNLGEVKVFGLLGGGGFETKFPESRWTTLENATNTYDISHPSSSCRYTLNFEGDNVTIKWTIPSPLFKVLADHHDHVFTVRAMGFF